VYQREGAALFEGARPTRNRTKTMVRKTKGCYSLLKGDVSVTASPAPDASLRAKVITLDAVRSRLSILWLVGGGLLFVLMVLQSLMGRYADKTQEAWGWLMPTIMPSLSMIVTVLGYTALDPLYSTSVVRKSFFNMAFWLSTLYLTLVLLTILVQPLVANAPGEAVGLMRQSNLWLGPFQGIVASALGVLFVSKQKGASSDSGQAR
jgi:hypothetical protein